MAKRIFVGHKPHWYENLPVSPAVLALVLAVVVIGGGAWALLGIFASPPEDAGDDAPAELGSASDAVVEPVVEAPEPELEFDASSVDAASGVYEINLFSAVDGTSEALGDSQTEAIDAAIADFADLGYQTGFVVLDLHTGKGIGYNADEEFFSASTIKAPFVTFLYQEFVDTGETELDEHLDKDYVLGGTGIMASESKQEYELEEVIADTIVYSDNTGYGMLRDHYEGPSWDEWTAAAGVPQALSVEGWYPFYGARDLAKYWIAINAYLETGCEDALSLKELFGTTEISFLRTALGSHSEVYAKAGFEIDSENGDLGAMNDAGIVSGPSGDYLIAVMSNADYDSEWMTENTELMTNLIVALDAAHAEYLAE